MIVYDHIQMSAHMGVEYDENAELVVKDAPPAAPSVDPAPVIQFPERREPEPDEDSFNEPFYPPAAEFDRVPGEGAGSLREEVAERAQSNRPGAVHTEHPASGRDEMADGAEGDTPAAPFDLETPVELDPLGIFEPGPADQPAAPRRRGRPRKIPAGA